MSDSTGQRGGLVHREVRRKNQSVMADSDIVMTKEFEEEKNQLEVLIAENKQMKLDLVRLRLKVEELERLLHEKEMDNEWFSYD